MKTLIPKLLVVDDDINSFKLISAYLSDFQSEIIYASCGPDAIAECKRNKDFSLIFMDINMAGMNGFEAAEKIQDFCKNIPIIYQTAYAKEFINDELMMSLGCGYLEKPIKKEKLIHELKKHISLHSKANSKSGHSLRNILTSMFTLRLNY